MTTTRNGVQLTSNGVCSVTIVNGGFDYIDGDPVEFTGGGGSDASGFINVMDGAIISVHMNHCGKAYTLSPIVTFPGGTGAVAVANIGSNYLLRSGYTDFTQNSTFDPNNEEQHPDVPDDAVVFNDPFQPDLNPTTWNGSEWQNN